MGKGLPSDSRWICSAPGSAVHVCAGPTAQIPGLLSQDLARTQLCERCPTSVDDYIQDRGHSHVNTGTRKYTNLGCMYKGKRQSWPSCGGLCDGVMRGRCEIQTVSIRGL